MYICLCTGVSDHQIKEALLSGKAKDFNDLKLQLGVSVQCGGCERAIIELVESFNQFHQTDTLVDMSDNNS